MFMMIVDNISILSPVSKVKRILDVINDFKFGMLLILKWDSVLDIWTWSVIISRVRIRESHIHTKWDIQKYVHTWNRLSESLKIKSEDWESNNVETISKEKYWVPSVRSIIQGTIILYYTMIKMEISVIINQKFIESVMFGKPVIPSQFSNDAKDNHIDTR